MPSLFVCCCGRPHRVAPTGCEVNVILSVAKGILPSLVREGGCGNATDGRVVVRVLQFNVLKLPLSQVYCLTAPKVMPQALLLTRGALFCGDRRLICCYVLRATT